MEGPPRRSAWPKDGPKQLWKINVGIGHSALSVVGARAFTMGNTDDIDTVFSIDIATGKIVWEHSYPCNEKVGIKRLRRHSGDRSDRDAGGAAHVVSCTQRGIVSAFPKAI